MNIHLDGFNHYGEGATGRSRMLDAAYLQVDGSVQPKTTNPRTDTMSLSSEGNVVGNPFWRRALPSTRTKLFLGMAHHFSNLPTDSARYCIAQFRTSGNVAIVTFGLSTTGQVQIRSGGVSGTILAESDPVIGANVFVHVECMAYINGAGASSAEARVNGQTAVSINEIDLGSTPIGQYVCGPNAVNSHGITRFYHADLRVGDDLGGVSDEFVGDRRVYTMLPTADGPVSEFLPDTGTARWSRVNEVPADGDTSYIQSQAPGDRQQLQYANLPDEVEFVGGIAFVPYWKKTDAGDLLSAINVVSGVVTGLGDVKVPPAGYQYDLQCFDVDPATDLPWTIDAVNALMAEIEHMGESASL